MLPWAAAGPWCCFPISKKTIGSVCTRHWSYLRGDDVGRRYHVDVRAWDECSGERGGIATKPPGANRTGRAPDPLEQQLDCTMESGAECVKTRTKGNKI
jgi:hypothetical protein